MIFTGFILIGLGILGFAVAALVWRADPDRLDNRMFALLAGGAMLALLTAGPVLAALQWGQGGNWTSPLLVSAAFYALTGWRAALQLRGIRPFVRAPREEVQRVERLNIWAWPLLIALNWVLLLSTAVGRTITWRGISYRMDGPQQTTILSRPQPASARKAA